MFKVRAKQTIWLARLQRLIKASNLIGLIALTLERFWEIFLFEGDILIAFLTYPLCCGRNGFFIILAHLFFDGLALGFVHSDALLLLYHRTFFPRPFDCWFTRQANLISKLSRNNGHKFHFLGTKFLSEYRATKVLGDTDFVDLKMRFAP